MKTKTIVAVAIMLGLLARTAFSQPSAYEDAARMQQLEEQRRRVQEMDRKLEALRQEAETTNMLLRRNQRPTPPVFSTDGTALTLGTPGWEEDQAQRRRLQYLQNQALDLERRRIEALEAIARSVATSNDENTRVQRGGPESVSVTTGQVGKAATYDQVFDQSYNQAVAEFPWMSDKNSSQFRRMQEVDRILESTGSPLYFNPQKPYIVAQIVAFEGVEKRFGTNKKSKK
jgi:hypothetical protein